MYRFVFLFRLSSLLWISALARPYANCNFSECSSIHQSMFRSVVEVALPLPSRKSTGRYGSRPYIRKYGEYPVDACGVTLYENTSSMMYSGHFRFLAGGRDRSRSWSVLLNLSH